MPAAGPGINTPLPGWTGVAGIPLHGRVVVGAPPHPPTADANLAQAAWFMRALIQLGWAARLLSAAFQVAANQLTDLPTPHPAALPTHSRLRVATLRPPPSVL